jgi:hypothetical protein
MAAVLCLVFLFALAAVALLLQPMLSSLAGIVALAVFTALAAGVFLGLFKMTRTWEAEAGPEH